MPIIQNLTGQKFGRLVVIEISHRVKNRTYWKCKCDCGNESRVTINKLRSGWTTSCGCYMRERQREGQLTHGMSGTTEMMAYSGMMTRCYNKNNSRYARYGARGIKVCDRWLGESGRTNFIADMGLKPSPGYSIERKENNGPYSPENCIWADSMTQGQNTSRVKNLTYNGKTQCINAWCRDLGLSETGVHTRLKNGWTIERILSTPKLVVVRRQKGIPPAASEIQTSAIAGPRDWLAD